MTSNEDLHRMYNTEIAHRAQLTYAGIPPAEAIIRFFAL